MPVIVENHAGSNGNIAGDMVAKAPPDGYTLLLGQDSLVAINPHFTRRCRSIRSRTSRRSQRSVSNQFVFTINPSLPVKNFQEFVEYARRTRRRCPTLPAATAASTTCRWKY